MIEVKSVETDTKEWTSCFISPEFVASVAPLPEMTVEYALGARTELRTSGGSQFFMREIPKEVRAMIEVNAARGSLRRRFASRGL